MKIYSVKMNVQRSLFIATTTHVESVNEAKDFFRTISHKYRDATHNCPAYRIIENNGILEFSSDAGEPSGTAGKPILGVLKKYELLNVAIVVTRYFGGVKLGIRGLIEAYSGIVEKLINSANIEEMVLMPIYRIKVNYASYGKIMQEIHRRGFIIKNTDFDTNTGYIEIMGTGDVNGFDIVKSDVIYIRGGDFNDFKEGT
ncbi:IMPACT family protein [Thermosipho ferrireducens]|uniref:IMPACT family protein n=1 Tax=Thermosipho ferrireducens TaxID=2571116 RepID=UPI001D195220|nr:YigZ family protein [Thermosipho ferrireducens]